MIQRVNLDFDQALALNMKNYKKEKTLSMFEYIYFLLNEDQEDKLLSHNNYTQDYLDYLSKKGFCITEIVSSGDYCNWWGDLNDIEVARKLNSKIWVSNWARDRGYCPGNIVTINDEESLREEVIKSSKEKYYYRADHGYSGVGNKVIYPEKSYSLKYPGTLLEYLDIVVSFGITVDLKNRTHFICMNNIDNNGVFLGGEIVDIETLECILKRNMKSELENIFDELEKECGPISIQFDSLLYKGVGIEWYKVVEINFRKTMGLVVHRLHSMYGKGKWIIEKNNYLSLTNKETENSLKNMLKKNVVVTSPTNKPLISYYTFG